jgi:hypothetical protein
MWEQYKLKFNSPPVSSVKLSYKKSKAIPVTSVEFHRVLRRRGSHIFHTIGSQLAVMFPPAALIPLSSQNIPVTG